MRRFSVTALVSVTLILAFPGLALAHGIGGRLDLPVPVSYFVVGAGIVLVVSFIALSVMWPEPRLQEGPRSEPARLTVRRRGPAAAVGVVSLLLIIGQLFPPLLGLTTYSNRPTIAPVLVWVMFWLVVPFAGAFIGDWYTDLNPWRPIARRLRIGSAERISLLGTAGVWPAAALLLGFTWLELVSGASGSPVWLGVAALAYTLGLMAVMALLGRETALASFDAFTPYNRLLSSISPVGRRQDGRLIWRGWLRALTVIPEWRGLAFLVVVAIGTVSYDGLSNTAWFKANLGTIHSTTAGATLLLLLSVAVIGAGYWLAAFGASRMGGRALSANRVAARFAHTLVPIALAYAVAHYLTLVVFEGQQLIAAISDPFALGWDIFGTADRKIDFFITASEPIWYVQVAVLVVGHVGGVVLAHDRALADFGPDAVRSQYAMLLLMVALTSLGLLILSG